MTKYKSLSEEYVNNIAETFGVGPHAINVYLASLELGTANIQDLSRKSGVKRTSIYNFIDDLKSKQLLVETKKGKRRLFSATDPRLLLGAQKSKMTLMEKMMPELLAINNKATNKPRVSYYEGVEGMKEVYNSMLLDKQVIYAWEDLDKSFQVFPKNFSENYPAERAKLNIPFRSIVKDSPLARKFISEKDKQYSRQSKLLQTDDFGTEINIFGDKVALFSLEKDSPFSVLIDDEKIARTLKIIWQEIWDRLDESV